MTEHSRVIVDGGKEAGHWSFEPRLVDGFGTERALPRGFLQVLDVSSISSAAEVRGLAARDVAGIFECFLQSASLGRDEVIRMAERCAASFGGIVQEQWPLVVSERSRHPVRVALSKGPARDPDGYGHELEATDIAREVAETIADLQCRIEQEARVSAAETGFALKYDVRRIMTVGSTSRGTYSGHLVDFDLVLDTGSPQAAIPRDDIETTIQDMVKRVTASSEYAAYGQVIGLPGTGQRPCELTRSFFGVRGRESFVSRHGVALGHGHHNLLDVTIGRLPQLVGYEIWIQRFLRGLSEAAKAGLRREIRLAKKLLDSMGSLYGVGIHGFRGNVVEQLVIQSWNYRCVDGSRLGSLRNALDLIGEECGHLSEGMQFAEFKTKFPLWHPGWWEADVGFSASGPGVNVLDLLGGGNSALAEQQWTRVKALARSHAEITDSGTCWSIAKVAGRARELVDSAGHGNTPSGAA